MSDPRNGLYLCAYDISDDRERRRVDRLLSGYGFRRQKSLFLCRLTRAARRRLGAALKGLGLKTGFVLSAPLAGQARVETFGEAPPDPDAGDCYLV